MAHRGLGWDNLSTTVARLKHSTGGDGADAAAEAMLPEVSITPDDVLAHWRLTTAVCERAHDLRDRAYWGGVFPRYAAFLRLLCKEQARATVPRTLRPPTELYHCWLVHMLQPKAYKDDCAELVDPSTGWFGTISHKFTAADLAALNGGGGDRVNPADAFSFLDSGDEAFRRAWASEYGFEYPALAPVTTGEIFPSSCAHGPLPQPFEHVDWWKGNDTLATLVKHVPMMAPEILEGGSALAESVHDYRRFLYATSKAVSTGSMLAPGAAIDLCWHTHQTNPIIYATDLSSMPPVVGRGSFFLDHNPCGEENPPQPEWMDASMKAWHDLFGPQVRLPRGIGADIVGDCCCAPGSGPTGAVVQRPDAADRRVQFVCWAIGFGVGIYILIGVSRTFGAVWLVLDVIGGIYQAWDASRWEEQRRNATGPHRVINPDGCEVRKGPTMGTEVFYTLAPGEVIEVTSMERLDTGQRRYFFERPDIPRPDKLAGGIKGWVTADDLRKEAGQQPDATTGSPNPVASATVTALSSSDEEPEPNVAQPPPHSG
eukprot:COSAG02_NODE_2371_length_9032_cov_26.076122_6_plen_542_part_00